MPEKGPPVFLDYDQAALDAAYDQAAYAPNREQLIKRRVRDSELARHRVRMHRGRAGTGQEGSIFPEHLLDFLGVVRLR